jgi:hypothetical protein
VKISRQITGRESLLSIQKAKDLLGYDPKFNWEDHL